MSFSFPPSCFDRANGIGGQPGTATPAGVIALKVSPASTYPYFFEEAADSPEIERAEQATISHNFNVDADTGLTLIGGLARGQILTDSYGNSSRILSAKYQHRKGAVSSINVTAEAISFDVPPDDFTVEAVEFNPSLFRHPRYSTVINYNLDSDGEIVDTSISNGPQIVSWIQGAVNFPQNGSRTEVNGLLNSTQIPDADVLALAQELLRKIQGGFDTFYLAGFKVTYSWYDFIPIDMNPGGYIEDPVASGNLPYYFWSDDGTPTGNDILTFLAATVAPAFYSGGLSWLRQSDNQQFQRTWFKNTACWIGGPGGFWDEQIYAST